MDPPASGDEVKPEKLEEAKDGGPLFHCDLFDSEIVHKIAQALLPGLASACVDNTTGDLLRSAASVAVDIRREMVDYLLQRSENFVAESVVLDGGPDAEVSDHPFDIISDFVDDFASSKRNFFSRVSGWLLSERREDRIDDFVQEVELDGFWLIGRREAVAQTLLKNVDFKNAFHCNMKFKVPEELDEHRLRCDFRTINCMNEGCNSRFSAAQLEHHDSICIFKILPCEQKCSESLMRREMDRHCITVCPMKLVNCPFYPVGCQSTVPQCKINEHRLDNLQTHLLYVLRVLHKEVSTDDLKRRMEQIEELSSPEQLAAFRDARSLAYAVKDLDAKLGPLEESKTKSKPSEEDQESIDKKESSASSITSEEKGEPIDKKESSALSTMSEEKRESIDKKESSASSTMSEQKREPLDKKQSSASSITSEEKGETINKKESSASSITSEEKREPIDKKERSASSTTSEEKRESIDKRENSASPITSEEKREPIDKKERSASSTTSEEKREPIDKTASPEQLAASRDARSLANADRDLDAKLGPLEDTKTKPNPSEEDQQSIGKKESSASSTTSEENRKSKEKKESSPSSTTTEVCMESPIKSGAVLQSTTKDHDCTESSREKKVSLESPEETKKCMDTPSRKEDHAVSLSQQEDLKKSLVQKEMFLSATMENQKQIEPHPEEGHIESTTKKAERTTSPAKGDEHAESAVRKEVCVVAPPKE